MTRRGVIETYGELVGVAPGIEPVTLLEGSTPLLPRAEAVRNASARTST